MSNVGKTDRRQIYRMARLLSGLSMLLVLLPAAVGGTETPADPVVNIGHRGASGLAPEHTFAAYDLALKKGADYIEQDVQLTSDGVLVSLHDTTLDRTARGPAENCTGAVRSKTLAQVKTCDMGIWFNQAFPQLARPEYVGQRIPTLEEVFRRYRLRSTLPTNFYIETKDPQLSLGMEEELLRLMGQYGLLTSAADRWHVLIQSFAPESLQKIHALNPTLPLIQLSPVGAGVVATLDVVATYAVGIGPSSGGVNAALVEAAHQRCLDVHPYTVNDPGQMANLIALGVDGMFTNFPDRLDTVLGTNAGAANAVASNSAANSRACRAG
jgi:glycerophosphoryl diester phosphodiesterase